VFSLFFISEGHFCFYEGDLRTENTVNLPMSTQNMIMEGVRRVDEQGDISRKITLEPPEPEPADEEEIGRMREYTGTVNQIMKDIYIILSEKTGDTALGNLNSFFKGQYQVDGRIFEGLSIMPDGGLDMDRVLGNLERMRPYEPEKTLKKALNELLFFELFEMKNFLTREESEQLRNIIRNISSEARE
jgi:hypothetical protein